MNPGWLGALQRAWRWLTARARRADRAGRRQSRRRIPDGSIIGRRFAVARRSGVALTQADIALGVALHDRDERLRHAAAEPLPVPQGFNRISQRIVGWRDTIRRFIDPRDGEWVKAIEQWPAAAGSSAATRLARAQVQADSLLLECEDITSCVAALPDARRACEELAMRGRSVMPRFWRTLSEHSGLEADLVAVSSAAELAAWQGMFTDCADAVTGQEILLHERRELLVACGQGAGLQSPYSSSLEADCEAWEAALEEHARRCRASGRFALNSASERHVEWLRSHRSGRRTIRVTSSVGTDWVLSRWKYLHAVVERDLPR